MVKKTFKPKGLFSSSSLFFSQVVSTSDNNMIFCSGQTSSDSNMNIIGSNDLKLQLLTCFENIEIALKSAGASTNDILHMRIYIVDYSYSLWSDVHDALKTVFGENNEYPSSTLIGISSLAHPELLCEVDVIASTPI